eukprot:67975_1
MILHNNINQNKYKHIVIWLWTFISLSMISNSNAVLCDDLYKQIFSSFPTTNKSRLRLVHSHFARCINDSMNGDVIASLRSLATIQPNDTTQMHQLREFNARYQFNEVWLLNYLKIMKRNHNLFLLNGSIINRILHLPTLQQMEHFNQTLSVDEHMSALEKGLIKLSWDMLVEYCNNSVDFNAYHILYQFLWRRIPSLPHILDLHPSTINRHHMNKMKKYNFVIWHYQISLSCSQTQSAFDTYTTSARWMMNNLQHCFNNGSLFRRMFADFLVSVAVEHEAFVGKHESAENIQFYRNVIFPVLSHLVCEGRFDAIDLILSKMDSAAFILGHQFQDDGVHWLDGLNLNQSETFLNVMLQYVGVTFSETERRIIARNLYAIKSDSIPMGQLQGVDRDHFLEELIQLLKKYRFILNQDVYLAQIKSEQSISQIQKMRNIESKFGMWLCFGLISGVLGFPPGILASLVAIFYYIGGELVNR